MKNSFAEILAQALLIIYIRSVESASRSTSVVYQNEPYSAEHEPEVYDFDSTDIYQTLHFKANWTKNKLFWRSKDFDFEGRYLREQTCSSNSRCQLPFMDVFVMPFSHNDPGWLQTFEGYFDTKTKFILDNSIEKLMQYKNMTFVWSEISFLSKWWDTASLTQKRSLRRLLSEGRFEILTGGWVMADESSPSIFALTNELVEGISWLKRNLNYKPTAAWSIDPFGHSSSMPYLLKSSGIEGMMVQRLHYAWKHWLAEHKNADFLWNQRWDTTGKHAIHCLNAHYDLYPTKHSCGPMPETCMKFNFRRIPGQENEEHLHYMTPVTNHNILQLADELMGQYRRTASLTKHNVIITGLGDDFQFNEALEWDQQYTNYDKLFQFINNNPQRYNARVQFGTLSQYFKVVKESNTGLSTFQGDFFPYSDTYFPYAPAYWTGYYGTRPFWKKLSREAEDELRKAEILFTFTLNHLRQQNYTSDVQTLAQKFNFIVQARRWVALFQHHDGITGTSPRNTMIDYAEKLFDAIKRSEHIQTLCAKLLVRRHLQTYHSYTTSIGESFANLADKVPLKFPDDGTTKKVVFFNSLGWTKSHLCRILVETPFLSVYGTSGEPITSQINPKLGTTENGDSGIFDGYYELVFVAYLQPLALTTYEIRKVEDRRRTIHPIQNHNLAVSAGVQCRNCGYNLGNVENSYVTLENDEIAAYFDGNNGILKGITRKGEELTAKVNLTYGKYDTGFGSGAYLSRPHVNSRHDLLDNCRNGTGAQLYVVSGPVLQEITVLCKELTISSYVLQQGYPESLSAVYLTNSVKPQGTKYGEFFMSFQTSLETKEKSFYDDGEEPTFYTDTGLAVEKRMKVSRLPYEASIYPVTNYAFIQDEQSETRFSILVDRAHGITSPKSGQLEIIFDRRLPYDDARGMDEGVNDPEDMVSNYVLVLEPFQRVKGDKTWEPSLDVQRASKFLNYQPTAFVYDSEASDNKNMHPRVALFSRQFPSDMFLLNMRTSAGSSRGVPSKRALMLLQNLGHMANVDNSKFLNSDLRVNHYAVATDLTGSPVSDEIVSGSQHSLRTAFIPKGNPYELSSYALHFR
ncbi:unnamed protein product [Orchesella dallaii]